jgi:hypothetical protein
MAVGWSFPKRDDETPACRIPSWPQMCTTKRANSPRESQVMDRAHVS